MTTHTAPPACARCGAPFTPDTTVAFSPRRTNGTPPPYMHLHCAAQEKADLAREERVRAAGPQLLAALKEAASALGWLSAAMKAPGDWGRLDAEAEKAMKAAQAAIAAAEKEA